MLEDLKDSCWRQKSLIKLSKNLFFPDFQFPADLHFFCVRFITSDKSLKLYIVRCNWLFILAIFRHCSCVSTTCVMSQKGFSNNFIQNNVLNFHLPVCDKKVTSPTNLKRWKSKENWMIWSENWRKFHFYITLKNGFQHHVSAYLSTDGKMGTTEYGRFAFRKVFRPLCLNHL